MSCISMPKKLKQLPTSSNNTFKTFTTSISRKLRKLHEHLKIPNSVTGPMRNLLHLRHNRRPCNGGCTRGTKNFLYRKENQYRPMQQFACNTHSSTVEVNKFFASSNTDNKNDGNTNSNLSSSNNNTIDNNKTGRVNWKEYVSKLPMLGRVDEKADEFISKFRHQMQLQREQSLLEFQEMLDRST